jgi:cobyrinic acid a,c-diamide synthase
LGNFFKASLNKPNPDERIVKGLLVAGTQSGIGKTTITLAILEALKDAGYTVQAYKVGPDFIDPTHLKQVTNEPCYNLDSFMMGEEGIKRELAKGDADYAVIEGAMGLYDGISSSAKIAEIAKVPVILVIDAQASSESVAAQALGFIKYSSFVPSKMTIAGIIANRVGSQKHAESIRKALTAINIPLVGTVRTDVEAIPSRHLGLYMGSETSLTPGALKSIYDSLDIEFIQRAAKPITVNEPQELCKTSDALIGIAYDAAFCFYYRSNIESIQKRAQVVYFSPIRDELPTVDGLYFGGGYPELYAPQLSANRHLLKDLKTNADAGMPIYGECDGLMFLSRSLSTIEGKRVSLGNVLPLDIQMTKKRQALGYMVVKAVKDCAIVRSGDILRGHEYHYSTADVDSDARFAYRVTQGAGIDGRDGVTEDNVVASYLHAHAYSMPQEFDFFIANANAFSRL